jgi:DNA-binding transcriptional LysR family regulator
MDRLTAMEVLVRVVETGSFSGAARQLRVGQPAVSKTIAQLEERLGVSLVLSSSRGLTPTEAGQNFYARAKRSIEETDETELAARAAGTGLAGRLRLSAGVRTTAAEGLREAVFAGLGLCVASEWMFQPDLDNGRVKQVLAAWTLPSMDLWAGIPDGPPRQRESARLRRLY